MAAPSPDTAIPRYLRYKAVEKSADDYWDEELERANSILHARVVRMERDKLCTVCARFEFTRTHFYTRNCRFRSARHEARCQKVYYEETGHEARFRKVRNKGKRRQTSAVERDLDSIHDDIKWYSFTTVQGVENKVKMLARHPDFKWTLDYSQTLACTLCRSILNTAEAKIQEHKVKLREYDSAIREFEATPRKFEPPLTPLYLSICLYGGPLFEEGGRHQCYEEWDSKDQRTNSWIAALSALSEGHQEIYDIETIYIRPMAEDATVVGSKKGALPHYCIVHHTLRPNPDFEIMNKWLTQCDEQHKHISNSCVKHRALSGFRLVDVRNQCIVESDYHTRYAALSYVWGSGVQYCLTTSSKSFFGRSGSLQKICQELRSVVLDSITVCLELSIPYLWVDSLCIVQDDAATKHHQIQCMDIIYANAYVTIVAAADEDVLKLSEHSSGAGLARVSVLAPAFPARSSLSIDGISYSVSCKKLVRSPDEEFSQSKWSSRGWTFQEMVLSHRILVFTPREVFFHCPTGTLSESVSVGGDRHKPLPLDTPAITLCGILQALVDHEHCISSISHPLYGYEHTYLKLLQYYVRRDLSQDKDVLNAFSGVINALSGSLGPFYWGLPQKFFVRALLHSITIGHHRSVSRRPDFPSWSWVGWKLENPEHDCTSGTSRLPHLFPLVHIHAYEQLSLSLLLRHADKEGWIEGFCTHSIGNYNKSTRLDPLPIQPDSEVLPKTRPILGQTVPVLIFWTHVARLKGNDIPQFWDYSCHMDMEAGVPRALMADEEVEVVLIAASPESSRF